MNITPDSFYSKTGGEDSGKALAKASELQDSGADIIDIGAESTRPGARPVSVAEEMRRLALFLENRDLNAKNPVLSIDTRNAATALYAIKHGVKIINDVSAFSHDPQMLEVLRACKPAYILTHAKGTPESMQIAPHYGNVIEEVMRFFENKIDILVKNGLPENRIALDPGIGFGKNLTHNLELLRNMKRFKIFGRPLVAAISMKSMFGDLLGHSLKERETDSAVCSALLWEKGVFWHRVHQPDKTIDAINLAIAMQK